MKRCLITHIGDSDGAFPIILSRLVFDKIDCFSCEKPETDALLQKALEQNYDVIYIVDLNISEDMAKIVEANYEWKRKVKVFDHHQSESYLNKYSFIKVVVEENGIKECGTTLYYQYLKELVNEPILSKPSLVTMIELVRQNDTFDFSDELKSKSLQFRNLYDIYGREKYIEHFLNFILQNDTFEFNGIEKELVELEEERSQRYIAEKLLHVKKAKINGISVGIVFAEQNRSLLGHTIVDTMPDVDIAVVINVDRSVSYRASKEEVDTNILAVTYGGGGHKHASGSPLPKDLQKRIVEYIFYDVIWEDLCK